jgi:hypothetical protein
VPGPDPRGVRSTATGTLAANSTRPYADVRTALTRSGPSALPAPELFGSWVSVPGLEGAIKVRAH